ncbi:MAG: FG-GAP-like repeat-containing protein [Candidatus Heimdallarchaeaceae archaeon]
MKGMKKSVGEKSKFLGMVIALQIIIIITSSIITNFLVMNDFNNNILDKQQNDVRQNNDYHTNLQEIEETKNDIENNTTSFRSELAENNFSGKKISQSLSSFGSWPINVGGELKGGPSAGDIDGDGNEEIVVGTMNGLLRVYETDGTESSNWIGGKNIGVALISTPMLANIDSNNATEEIIIGAANGSVYAFYGNGTSIPGWPVNCEGAVEETLAVGDINGDGKNEIIVGSNSSKVYAFYDNGSIIHGWPKTTGGEVIVSPVLADVDNDGSNDVIVGSTDGKVYAWKGNGDIISNFPKDLLAPITHPLAVADINNDGKIDIVCPAGRTLYLLSHSGTTIHFWITDSSNSEWLGPIIVDINWDREYEIISLSTNGEQKSFSFNGETLNEYSSSLGLNIQEEPIVTDVDNDNNWELLYCSSSNVYAKHFYSSSTNEELLSGYLHTNGIIVIQGQYLYYTDYFGYILAAEVSSTNVFDWTTTNYDTTNSRYNYFIYYYSPLSSWPQTTRGAVWSLAVADLDDDSELEIIAGHGEPCSGGVTIWNSDGTVVPGWPQLTTDYVFSIAVANLDDDSELEIIEGCDDEVTIWNSDGTVVPGWPQTTSGYVRSLAVADVDDDSALEIIAGYGGEVTIWNSDGTVVPSWPKATGGVVYSLAVADVDDDSALEIIAGYDGGVTIWNSNGTVVPGWPKTKNSYVYSLAVADVDDDSVLEIIAGDGNGVIIWNSIGLGYAPLYTDSVNNQRTGTYLDSDDDGLFDHEEKILGTDISKVDTDSDGLNDFNEINIYSTDPTTADTDSDGLNDFNEINIYSTDPTTADTDSDGMIDSYEVYSGLDPFVDDANSDLDNDGLMNIEEFTLGTFTNSTDTDEDSMDDLWEVQTGTNPLIDDTTADLDNDTLTNLDEYTLGTFANNSDTDSDGMIDSYEVYSGLDPFVDDANSDLDNDGLMNIEEFTLGTFTNSTDTDNDGLTDYEEVKEYFTNPNDNDSDNDGLTDYEEVKIYGTDPNDDDTDNDGEPDGLEIENNLDPLNSKSNLEHKQEVNRIIILIAIIVGAVLTTIGISFLIFIRIKLYLRKKATTLGFSSIKEMFSVKKLGFENKLEWEEITRLGYKTKSDYLKVLKREENYKILINLLNQFNPSIPVSLQRISKLSGFSTEKVEEYIKDILQSNPDIGEYYELEQSFIRKETINVDNEIDRLLSRYREWETAGEGKKKD